MDVDEALRRAAAQQHAVLAWGQARALGATGAQLRRRVGRGAWTRPSPRVLRRTGSVRTFRQRCVEGVLDAGPGSAASHLSAAGLLSLPGFDEHGDVEVSRLRGRRGAVPTLAVLHRTRFLPPHHVRVVDAVPTTTVARTLFDLAGCRETRVERALDNALSRKLVSLQEVRRTTIELLESGRTGSALMRELLEERGAGYVPPGSGLEARFLGVLIGAGLPVPVCQVDLGDDAWVGRVDFLYRDVRLVIEVDGETFHTSQLDRAADARRDAALGAAGFRVLRVTEADLRERPDQVLARVSAARRAVA